MTFASPWFLLLLAPWLALTLLLLWGRRRRVPIPFLDLWKGPILSPAPKRSFEWPPLWLAAAIFAMLLAILGASRPAVRWGGEAADGPLLTIILDRGLTLSSSARYHALIEEAAGSINQAFPAGPADLLAIPGTLQRTGRAHWPTIAKSLPPTAADTRESLRAAIHDRLAHTTGPVILLSDQPIDIDDSRLVRIAPPHPARNVAIEHLAVRESPTPQLMLRLRNDSAQGRVSIRIRSDPHPAHDVELDLPAPGAARNIFVDLPAVGDTIAARLLTPDDIPADDSAALVRQRLWPALEPRTALPAEVQRMVASYARLRPPGPASPHVAIVNAPDALPLNEPAILLLPAAADSAALIPAAQLTIADHPITRAVEVWPAPAGSSEPVGEGWKPIVRQDGRPLVAIREDGAARQAWVNLPTSAWATHPSFVIFWTNLFDHLGQGGEAFSARPPGRLDGVWTPLDDERHPAGTPSGLWPGLYQRPDGAIAAVNAPPVPTPTTPAADWRTALHQAPTLPDARQRSLTPIAILLSISLLLLAALAWKTPAQRPRPVV